MITQTIKTPLGVEVIIYQDGRFRFCDGRDANPRSAQKITEWLRAEEMQLLVWGYPLLTLEEVLSWDYARY